MLSARSVRYWGVEYLVLAILWPVVFPFWLLVSARFIFRNIVSQYRGEGHKTVRDKVLVNVLVGLLLTVAGFLGGRRVAPNSLNLFGITVPAFLLYAWAFMVPIVWLGAKRYINQFLPFHNSVANLKLEIWLRSVCVLTGWWLAYAYFQFR